MAILMSNLIRTPGAINVYGSVDWSYTVDTGFTAAAEKGYLCDTSTAARAVVLPGSSAISSGQLVGVGDGENNAATNNITITVSDGVTINGSTDSVVIDVDSGCITFVYDEGQASGTGGYVIVANTAEEGGTPVESSGMPWASWQALNSGTITASADNGIILYNPAPSAARSTVIEAPAGAVDGTVFGVTIADDVTTARLWTNGIGEEMLRLEDDGDTVTMVYNSGTSEWKTTSRYNAKNTLEWAHVNSNLINYPLTLLAGQGLACDFSSISQDVSASLPENSTYGTKCSINLFNNSNYGSQLTIEDPDGYDIEGVSQYRITNGVYNFVKGWSEWYLVSSENNNATPNLVWEDVQIPSGGGDPTLNLVDGIGYLVDASLQTDVITASLPQTPNDGDVCGVKLTVNSTDRVYISVDGNGNTIEGEPINGYRLSSQGDSYVFRYNDETSTWLRLYVDETTRNIDWQVVSTETLDVTAGSGIGYIWAPENAASLYVPVGAVTGETFAVMNDNAGTGFGITVSAIPSAGIFGEQTDTINGSSFGYEISPGDGKVEFVYDLNNRDWLVMSPKNTSLQWVTVDVANTDAFFADSRTGYQFDISSTFGTESANYITMTLPTAPIDGDVVGLMLNGDTVANNWVDVETNSVTHKIDGRDGSTYPYKVQGTKLTAYFIWDEQNLDWVTEFHGLRSESINSSGGTNYITVDVDEKDYIQILMQDTADYELHMSPPRRQWEGCTIEILDPQGYGNDIYLWNGTVAGDGLGSNAIYANEEFPVSTTTDTPNIVKLVFGPDTVSDQFITCTVTHMASGMPTPPSQQT